DLAIGLVDSIAFAFFAPLFLHFCTRYPVRVRVLDKHRWPTYLLYLPATLLSLALVIFSVVPALAAESGFAAFVAKLDDAIGLYSLLNSLLLYHFIAGISGGALFLIWRFIKNHQTIVRQRLKWAIWGTIAAVLPILLIEIAVRFGMHIGPEDISASAVRTLPLALIPLSFGHSVVRYRLMDVDVVVRRALVY